MSLRRRQVWPLAAWLATACATAPTLATPSPRRAVGAVTWHDDTLSLEFDIAVMLAAPDRARLDIALPHGASMAILWIIANRWILVDPSAATAWNGTAEDVAEVIPVLPNIYQAALALGSGLVFLNAGDDFGTLTGPVGGALSVTGAVGPWAGAGAARWVWGARGEDAWQVTVERGSGDPAPDWPERWRVARGNARMEVVWRTVSRLDPSELRLLRPDLPASLQPRSFRSLLPPAADVPQPP